MFRANIRKVRCGAAGREMGGQIIIIVVIRCDFVVAVSLFAILAGRNNIVVFSPSIRVCVFVSVTRR